VTKKQPDPSSLPVDYHTWTEVSSKATQRIETDLRQLMKNTTTREIRIEGSVSPKKKNSPNCSGDLTKKCLKKYQSRVLKCRQFNGECGRRTGGCLYLFQDLTSYSSK